MAYINVPLVISLTLYADVCLCDIFIWHELDFVPDINCELYLISFSDKILTRIRITF